MNAPKLSVPKSLSFVVVAAATFAGPWIACGGGGSGGGNGGSESTSTSTSETTICIEGADAGPKTMCPDVIDAGDQCPPGCQREVV